MVTKITANEVKVNPVWAASCLLYARLTMSGAEKAGMKKFTLRTFIRIKLLFLYNEKGSHPCSEEAVADLSIDEVDGLLQRCIYNGPGGTPVCYVMAKRIFNGSWGNERAY